MPAIQAFLGDCQSQKAYRLWISLRGKYNLNPNSFPLFQRFVLRQEIPGLQTARKLTLAWHYLRIHT